MADKKVIRKVNELKIRCTNHREGCGWVGELGELKSHLDSDKGCGYVEVTCTNKGCGERVSRKDLQTHLEKCYYRPYECEYCGHKDTYTAITGKQRDSKCPNHPPCSPMAKKARYTDHYSECPEYPLACPNRCGVTGIRRRAMPDHHSSCPLEPLDCPFKDAGCTEKIARKDMEHHMTANQQKHMLLTFQSLQQTNGKLQFLQDGIKREIDSLEESLRCNTNTRESTAQSLSCMKSILQVSLDKIGDTLTFRVRDYPQLREEKKAWHSPPFSIGAKVRVSLAVYPSGVGRGQGSHVSVSLILKEVLQKEENMLLEYNVSVTGIGRHTSAALIGLQHRSTAHKTLELCSWREGVSVGLALICSAHFPFPSPGEVLRSKERFLEIKEANSLLENDALTLELKLLEHQHHL